MAMDVMGLADPAHDEAITFLRAIGNDVRLAILRLLAEHSDEWSVTEINSRIRLSQSALSQHLAVLRSANLVETRRESQTIYYRLSDHRVLRQLELLGL